MIHIKETFPNDQLVMILVDGTLDRESMSILKDVCQYHLETNRKVMLNLKGLIHISREGRDFLQEIQNTVQFIEPPYFLRLEDQNFE